MYIPHHYKNQDIKAVKSFIKENGFGILVTQLDDKPCATHIPFYLDSDDDGKDILVSHIAKANPQWKSFANQKEVLCIFNGPHSYISSSWYKDEEVPTWNYIAVHVYGTISILSEEEVMTSMHQLVDKYEKNSQKPLSLHNLSSKTLRQVKGVVGFKIRINNIEAAQKLSQGRAHDHPAIISELKDTRNPGSIAIAKEMKNLPS